MKVLIIIAVLLGCTSSHSADIGKEINTLFETIGVKKFKDSIQKIHLYKSIEEIGELDYELKEYYKNLKLWYYFDEIGFVSGLKGKLRRALTKKEIISLQSIFSKPFILKVLTASVLKRDLFDFHTNALITDFKFSKLVKSRYDLIKNIYILHGMEIQNESLKEKLKYYVESGLTSVAFINKNNGEKLFVEPYILKNRYENTEDFIINYLAMELSTFRHYELREYIRKMKGKTVQKFLQIYANYHYLYITKYLSKVQQDKINALKILGTKEN